MKTVKGVFSKKIDIKKSNFIAYLCEIHLYDSLLKDLKNEHSKAVHFVYAYRKINENKQIIEDKSDDFEPKNSAGLPCLNVLRGNELVNTAVIVVRYFGGIKLGVGGLVRAYTEATNAVIKEATLYDFEFKDEFFIKISLKDFQRLKYLCTKHNISFCSDFSENEVCINLLLNTKEQSYIKEFLSP